MYVKADHREWDVHIHEFRHALNTVMQSTIKVSPAFLHFRRHPRPVKSLRRQVETQSRGLQLIERVDPEVRQHRIKRLDVLRDMVAKNIERAGDQQERLYNSPRFVECS